MTCLKGDAGAINPSRTALIYHQKCLLHMTRRNCYIIVEPRGNRKTASAISIVICTKYGICTVPLLLVDITGKCLGLTGIQYLDVVFARERIWAPTLIAARCSVKFCFERHCFEVISS